NFSRRKKSFKCKNWIFFVLALLVSSLSLLQPACFVNIHRGPGEGGKDETHQIVLSFISCFAGGVFLANCPLFPLMPEAAFLNLFFRSQQGGFPVAEFIMACGFFTVLILERIVLSCTGPRSEETSPLLGHGHGHAHGHRSVNDMEGSAHHVHVDLQAHSSFRSFMLFLSLSLHSVFEGLAIGLQTTDAKVKKTLRTVGVRLCILVVPADRNHPCSIYPNPSNQSLAKHGVETCRKIAFAEPLFTHVL
uniref:Solute carrier family 39 member 1 n=1 Tax=Astyanax mexicanus TaxID=7994 RepID=A0A8B9KYE4_ASTMX